jgi:hypothetical protein
VVIVFGSHIGANGFARVLDASRCEKLAQRFARHLVSSLYFALGLLF